MLSVLTPEGHDEEVARRRAALRQAPDSTIAEMEAEQARQFLEPARILLDEIARRRRLFCGAERLELARWELSLQDAIRELRHWLAVARDRKRDRRRARGEQAYQQADLAVDEAQAMLRRGWKTYRQDRAKVTELRNRLAAMSRPQQIAAAE